MLTIFSTIKRVKLRAKCDLVPKRPIYRQKINDTQEQFMTAFNISQNVDDFGFNEEDDKEEKTKDDEDDEEEDEIGFDFASMVKGFMNYCKTSFDDAIPAVEKSIDTATKAVHQSIQNVQTTTQELYNQSIENVTSLTEHPIFIASLPIVSATIGSAVGEMIAGQEGKKAFARSIGSSLGRVAGEQIALSLNDKKIKKSSIKEQTSTEEEVDTPRKLRRRN